MTKKVKDLTEEEIEIICSKKGLECSPSCPLFRKQEGHYRLCALPDTKESIKIVINDLLVSNKNGEFNERLLKYRNQLREVEEDLEIEIDVED